MAQSPIDGSRRKRIATEVEQQLRNEGCADCRVWVRCPDNAEIHILGPDIRSKASDYDGRPTFFV
jgi:hypothetical protein